MNYSFLMKKIFEDFIKEKFSLDAMSISIVIYGNELQICGGLLNYIEPKEYDISLIHYDLRYVENEYSGYVMKLPTMIENKSKAYVLVSLLYQYQYEDVRAKLICDGYKPEHIVHIRDLSEKILDVYSEYYAQNRMDLKVKELFDSIGRNIASIQYLDIGCNNYLLYNNTYLFYKNGASGVLIEANPDFGEILKQKRPRDVLISAGCASKDLESMRYYKTNRAGYNTFIESIAKTYAQRGIEITETINVPVYGINNILRKYYPDGHIDYMSIDIEGMGEEVLFAINFDEFNIDVILAEMEFDTDFSREVYSKLINSGYKVKSRGIGLSKDFLFYKKDVFEKILV